MKPELSIPSANSATLTPTDTQGFMGAARHQGGRSTQQDQVICLTTPDRRRQFLVVADGVGGHSGGEMAAQCVVDVAARVFPALLNQHPQPAEFLTNFCTLANQEILARAALVGSEAYSTVVALFTDPARAYWAHVGDSRLYGFKRGELMHQTRDHSLVQQLFEQGKITAEDRATHPARNQVQQVLGMDVTIKPTLGEMALCDQCAFLLCSDGFWDQVSVDEMSLILGASDLAFATSVWVRQAARRGGTQGDNIALAVWRAPPKVVRRWSFFR